MGNTSVIGLAPCARSLNNRLHKNFAWTLAGNAIYGATQWSTWVLLARLGNPEMVGEYALAQAIASPIILFSNMALRSIQATDTDDEVSFGNYLALRILTTVVALVTIGAIGCIWTSGLQAASIVLLMGILKSIESMSDVYFGLLQNRDRMDRISKSLIIKGLCSAMVLGAVLHITRNLAESLVAVVFVWSTIWAVYDRQATNLCRVGSFPIWDLRSVWKLLLATLPLGITMLLISLNGNVPRYFLKYYGTDRQLGIFAALTSIQTAGSMFIMAIGQSATTQLARTFAYGNIPGFRRLVVQLMGVAAILGLATLLMVESAGDLLVRSFFGAEYTGQIETLRWIAVGATVSYISSILGYAATASRCFRFQPYAFGATTLVTSIGCWLAVPRFGGLGAAYAATAGAFVGCTWYGLVFLGNARLERTS